MRITTTTDTSDEFSPLLIPKRTIVSSLLLST